MRGCVWNTMISDCLVVIHFLRDCCGWVKWGLDARLDGDRMCATGWDWMGSTWGWMGSGCTKRRRRRGGWIRTGAGLDADWRRTGAGLDADRRRDWMRTVVGLDADWMRSIQSHPVLLAYLFRR